MCNRVVNTKREKNEMFDFPSTPHYLEGIDVYAASKPSSTASTKNVSQESVHCTTQPSTTPKMPITLIPPF